MIHARHTSYRYLFAMFLLSGFCGLLYQVVWLRLAFAKFGVITPVISVVLSVFMLGLSLGSVIAGKWARGWSARFKVSPIFLYGIVEILIGLSAFIVPVAYDVFSRSLLGMGEMSSVGYLFNSAFLIMLAILPWCVLMGMTFPLGIAFLETESPQDKKGFSFLYLANVIGAMLGTALTALVFVETLGFRKTLYIAALANFAIGGLSLWLAAKRGNQPLKPQAPQAMDSTAFAGSVSKRLAYGLLFMTGFCSMAMEVVWTRAFTPVTSTTIYSFAFLLTTYLLATWVGSYFYRKHLAAQKTLPLAKVLNWLALTSLLPLLVNDPLLHPTVFHLFLGLFPICALLGYLTPQLIDSYSAGNAEKTGAAYAVNVLGCIIGPLFAGYLLLSFLGVKWSLLILALPFFAYAFLQDRRVFSGKTALASVVLLTLAVLSRSYEDRAAGSGDWIKRDYTATVIAKGEGMNKELLVNGFGMTVLTPITKVMAHFPLASLKEKPESALVICFGMGTTFRSLVSWGIDTTAVELVPSVKDMFGYYHKDAAEVVAKPNGHIVVDDGRRFLARTGKRFDLITIDPPPPVEAAGSSLLYTREFYDLIKSRLKPNGIMMHWFPGGEPKILYSISRSIIDKFKYVKVYQSVENVGFHFFASDVEFPEETGPALIARMPSAAKDDLMEWFPGQTIEEIFRRILARRVPIEIATGAEFDVPLISDDRPYNEYFLGRRWWRHIRRFFARISGQEVPTI